MYTQVFNIHAYKMSNNLLTLDFDDFEETTDPYVKKVKVLQSTEDLLVLSATWHRIRKSRTSVPSQHDIFPSELTDKVLYTEITPEDRIQAEVIRDFYSKKLMMWALTEKPLSRFREDMRKFIISDGTTFTKDINPLVYRLPEFYEYDVAFNAMHKQHNIKLTPNQNSTKSTKQLKLCNVFTVGRSLSKRKEYWFSDEHNNLVNITLPVSNPLLNLFEKCLKDTVVMEATYSKKIRDDAEWLIASKFNLV